MGQMQHERLWREYQPLVGMDSQSAAMVDFMDKHQAYLRQWQSEDAQAAVVIPTYWEMHRIARMLASLNEMLKINPQLLNVIVADNGSGDATAEVAKFYGVEVVVELNKGVGNARQAGLEATNGNNEIVLTSDADTVVPAEWVVTHSQALLDPSVVFSGGPVRFLVDQKMPLIEGMLFGVYMTARQKVQERRYRRVPRFQMAGGANSAFRRDQALEVGYRRVVAGEDGFIRADLIDKFGGRSVSTMVEVLSSARRMVDQGLRKRLYMSAEYRLRLLMGMDVQREAPMVYEDIRPESEGVWLRNG